MARRSEGAVEGRSTGKASPALELTATRSLAVLDELRVPYTRVPQAGGGRWHRISAGHPARALHWYAPPSGMAPGRHTVGELPLWGRFAAAGEVARLAAELPGTWHADSAVVDGEGHERSRVWRSSEGGTILPFDPDELVLNLRSERYRQSRAATVRGLEVAVRRLYYRLKPLVPRGAQLFARRRFQRIQARADFPRWPLEPALHDLVELVLAGIAEAAGEPVPYIAPWPQGHTWAFVLTHDVEWASGRDAIDMVRAVEEAAGMRSSWNLVPERYAVPDALVERLRADGCEVGVHGLRHDGRDFESLRTFERRLPEIRRWADRWGAVGFRAPATHRVWEWMPRMGFAYDSSYPDTDPYEPIAGGCCSWLPFFNGEMVELPITMPQDHTIFEILRAGEEIWQAKAEQLRQRGGMALVLTHPDYQLDPEQLRAYERLLQAYADDPTAWKPLPRELCDWWRLRAATSLEPDVDGWRAVGPADADAAVVFVEPKHA